MGGGSSSTLPPAPGEAQKARPGANFPDRPPPAAAAPEPLRRRGRGGQGGDHMDSAAREPLAAAWPLAALCAGGAD